MGNEEDIKRILELMRTTPLVELEEQWSQFSRQVDFSTMHEEELVNTVKGSGINLDMISTDRQTFLLWSIRAAVRTGQERLTRILLKAGANPNLSIDNKWILSSSIEYIEDMRHLISPVAQDRAFKKIVELLIEHNADVESAVKHSNLFHNTDHKLLKLLLSKCSPEFIKDNIDIGLAPNGNIPLISANFEKAQILLEYGANPNAVNLQGNNALHMAGNLKKVQILLKHGANPNAVNLQGNNALHMAAMHDIIPDHIAILELLINNKADIGARNVDRNTPFDLAREKFYSIHPVAKLIRDYEARIDVVANNVIRRINGEVLSTQELDEFVHINNIQPQLLVAKIGEKNSAIDASKEIKKLENYRSENFGRLSRIHARAIPQKENKDEPSLADLAREPALFRQIFQHLQFAHIKTSTSTPGSSHTTQAARRNQAPSTSRGGGNGGRKV
ncbi:ankyrin repeat domain-containing protein [Candidatus Tisiphia endosymbiont of Beris chalybata]|uniref:ankyrin repeat domain-containing protein n=1 Tax=Candidatus Tisiphia endosymbiont of Beris chalybata TaxID=3066262 RepID=UPI00312C71D1